MVKGPEEKKSLRPGEVIRLMEEEGVNVVAHLTIEGRHEYNVTKKQLGRMVGEIEVLKWERDSLAGPKAKKQFKKKALYQIKT